MDTIENDNINLNNVNITNVETQEYMINISDGGCNKYLLIKLLIVAFYLIINK